MDVGQRIKLRRKEVKLSAEILAQKIGVSKSTIHRYEKGDIEKVPIDVIVEIAQVLNTTPAFLMGWEDSQDEISELSNIYIDLSRPNKDKVVSFAKELHQKQNRKPKQMTVLYIDGYVSAGSGFFQDDHLDAEISIPTEEVPEQYDLVAKVIGQSMQPKIHDGDLIFIRYTQQVDNHALGVFDVNGANYIKQLKLEPQPYLKSLNRDYDDVMLTESDEIRTIGEVVEVWRK